LVPIFPAQAVKRGVGVDDGKGVLEIVELDELFEAVVAVDFLQHRGRDNISRCEAHAVGILSILHALEQEPHGHGRLLLAGARQIHSRYNAGGNYHPS